MWWLFRRRILNSIDALSFRFVFLLLCMVLLLFVDVFFFCWRVLVGCYNMLKILCIWIECVVFLSRGVRRFFRVLFWVCFSCFWCWFWCMCRWYCVWKYLVLVLFYLWWWGERCMLCLLLLILYFCIVEYRFRRA